MLLCVPVADAAQPKTLPTEALSVLRRIAVQHNGRNKPFDSFARETLQLITGEARFERQDPVATVFVIMADPDHWQQTPLISVPFIPLREQLEMDHQASHISYNDLVASRKLMRMLPPIMEKQRREEKLSILENEAMDAFQRFVALSELLEQKLNLVPPPRAADVVWLPVFEPLGYAPEQQDAIRTAWTDVTLTVRESKGQAMAAAHLSGLLRGLQPAAYPAGWRLNLEVFYNHTHPFRVAQLLYLLAIIGLVAGLAKPGSAWMRAGLAAALAAFAVHGAGILMRVVIGGRPPVSNFFETTLWLPFVGVAVALIFERIFRAGYPALAASILAVIALVLSEYLPLDPSISPVVAVLHSNLWLTIHVLTIVASYGALGLATVLAHIYGVQYLMGSRDCGMRIAECGFPNPKSKIQNPKLPPASSLGLLLYRTIQVGVVLLAGGIMLGAVWANASWGRYWGWDPKETWALITLLWFLAVLHGRFAGWITGIGVALSTIGGFFLLLMTYYGVSFYLVGLHSYAGGHAKPLPPLLIGYVVAEAAFMAWVGLTALHRRTP